MQQVVLADRYELSEPLGNGSMGEVWLALDRVLERRVAVKLLRAPLGDDPAFAERFRTEARAMASVSHPGIVAVYDYGQSTTSAGAPLSFLVMELIEGEPLSAVLERSGPLPVERVLRDGAQVLDALQAAHDAGIVHRDVKPANLLVRQDTVLVTDFGIAWQDYNARLTSTGTQLGTVPYQAPEQAARGEVTAAADVYAVGVVLYECLTGCLPFDGVTAFEITLKHLTTPPPPLPEEVPPAVRAVVERALAKEPGARWADAAAMASALRVALVALPEGAGGPVAEGAVVEGAAAGDTAVGDTVAEGMVAGGPAGNTAARGATAAGTAAGRGPGGHGAGTLAAAVRRRAGLLAAAGSVVALALTAAVLTSGLHQRGESADGARPNAPAATVTVAESPGTAPSTSRPPTGSPSAPGAEPSRGGVQAPQIRPQTDGKDGPLRGGIVAAPSHGTGQERPGPPPSRPSSGVTAPPASPSVGPPAPPTTAPPTGDGKPSAQVTLRNGFVALENEGQRDSDGNSVVIAPFQNSPAQQWCLDDLHDGTYLVRNLSTTGRRLDLDLGSQRLIVWGSAYYTPNQVWLFQPDPSGGKRMVNRATNECLTARPGTGQVAMEACTGSPGQVWTVS
ncbi:protein kinase domain-containing protein [Streptomyces sp. NPDC002537]